MTTRTTETLVTQPVFTRATESGRYERDSILRSEFVYGHGFQGPGGPAVTEKLLELLEFSSGHRVLEMGCGCGGAAFRMAEKGAEVIGVDYTPAMIEICNERIPDCKKEDGSKANVRFQVGSMVDASLFPAGSFDSVYCRDALLYIKREEIKQTLKNFRTWLRPAGRLMVTNYNLGATPGPNIEEYQELAQLTLQTLEDFADEVRSAGFTTEIVDESPDFAKHYKDSYEEFIRRQVAFEQKFGTEHFRKLKHRWELKLRAIAEGGMRGGMVMAMA